MATLVVGGHTRNIGKTSVMEAILRALPEHEWTAIKITQYGHGICSANGEPCDCVTADHSLAVSEERDATTGTDTSRYLAAGAAHSFWVRTQQGMLAEAMPLVRKKMGAAGSVLIESNSVMQFLRPDLYLAVLNPSNPDFKPSALRFLDRADAVLLANDVSSQAVGSGSAWANVAPGLLGRLRCIEVQPPEYVTEEVINFIKERLKPLSK